MWDYNDKVMEHFINPKNVGEIDEADAEGEVGNMSCGDALRLTLKISPEGIIEDARFKTFGCASAIASSSALTELVKGMTIDEADKVTNQDIVKILGELPEEKMHCSVMGMEALQAAIANYRGGAPVKQDDNNHEGRIVCHCFGVTDTKIRAIARQNNLRSAEEIRNYSKAGGGCGGCLDSIQEILDGLWRDEPGPEPVEMPGIVQKVLKIQEVIEKEIQPMLEQDGGGLALVDVVGNIVKVKLKGRCAVCPTSHLTMKHTIEQKLREFISPELEVEEVK
ncbi:MAG: Fe-S cluster assembly protein NifU [Victivallales bacterium]|nr:Fe-S cluster assembly protein NifU [Victivallales bacterium]